MTKARFPCRWIVFQIGSPPHQRPSEEPPLLIVNVALNTSSYMLLQRHTRMCYARTRGRNNIARRTWRRFRVTLRTVRSRWCSGSGRFRLGRLVASTELLHHSAARAERRARTVHAQGSRAGCRLRSTADSDDIHENDGKCIHQ